MIPLPILMKESPTTFFVCGDVFGGKAQNAFHNIFSTRNCQNWNDGMME